MLQCGAKLVILAVIPQLMNGPSFDRSRSSKSSEASPLYVGAHPEVGPGTEDLTLEGDVKADWTLVQGPKVYEIGSGGYLVGVFFAPGQPGAVVFQCHWLTALSEIGSIIEHLLPRSRAELSGARLFLGGMAKVDPRAVDEFVGRPISTTIESDRQLILQRLTSVGLSERQIFVRWESDECMQSIIIDPSASTVCYREVAPDDSELEG